MEIMLMIGSYAGQVRDVRPIYARELIARGEAIDVHAPLAPAPVAQAIPGGSAVIPAEVSAAPADLLAAPHGATGMVTRKGPRSRA